MNAVPSAATPSASRAPRLSRDQLLRRLQQSGLLIFFSLLVIVFAIIRPEFVSEANVKNILQSAAIVGILACGQTIVMLTGGFDLSIARNAVVAGLVAALLTAHIGPLAGLAALAVSAGVGLVNGTLIARGRVNPFIVTLGTYTILGSVALLVNNGESVSGLDGWVTSLTGWRALGFSSLVFWFFGVAVLTHVLLAYTKFGRHVYAVGGNLEASRLSGVRSNRVLTIAYGLAGLLAGVAGILLTSRLSTASPAALPGVELDAIAAVIIGGTRMSGGFGSIPRTIVGVLILTSLTSALVILQVATYWQGVLKGAIIIVAVAVDVAFSRRR
ncbi:MAG TPA: ABC transporter permease [Cellulomonas sp.]